MLFSTVEITYAMSDGHNIQVTPVVHTADGNNMGIKGFKYEGTLSPNTPVTVTFQIPLKNVNLLYYYAEETSNPDSQMYHHFLSKEQVMKLFYPKEQYQKLMSWIRQEGLKVISTSTDSVVVVEGRAYQFQQMGLQFSLFSNGSETYYSASEEISYPVNAFVYSSNVSALFFQHPSTLFSRLDVKQGGVNTTAPIEGYPIKALREAYNVTSIFSKGIKGSPNFSIGILDFYGDPYIKQELAYYDHAYNISNPPYFHVVPIGPYDPNLGVETGWAGEISLDVESSHTMAPDAGIVLYIANGNLPLYSIISCIDQQDNVTDLSQSFSIPEESFSTFSAPQFYSCVVLTDEYYAMGSAEGITFLASSGDAGGSGYSAGPLGTVGYPSTSPWVTAMGGTTTYIDFGKGVTMTSWSNYGFIPDGVNYGGSTGGVSIIEPKPWYQDVPTPSSYPQGREVPDLSANANAYPGVYIICPGNVTEISGGTSEASPLMAGMIALLAEYTGEKLGDINPVIYQLASNTTIYQKAFVPITFGYNIPWNATYGYNLVNGWGSVNLGYLAYYMQNVSMRPSLSVSISVMNGTPNVTLPQEVFPGESLQVMANVTYNGTPVVGNVMLEVSDVMGNLVNVQMQKIGNLYYANITLPNDSNGIISITVIASAQVNNENLSGVGMVETFGGYYICFTSPSPMTPYFAENNITVEANVEGIYGQISPQAHVELGVYEYRFSANEYQKVGTITLNFSNTTDNWVGYLQGNYSPGIMILIGENAYGFVSFYNGFDLQSMFILPQVISEPGTVAGGQYITITGSVTPPANLPSSTSSNSEFGTTINASLERDGQIVSTTELYLNSTTGEYEGYLYVPPNVTQGLYNVILNAEYQSYSLGENITGRFYGQIYVVPRDSLPEVMTSTYSPEGSMIHIYANISYPNGTPVTYGMYSATVFPYKLAGDYPLVSELVELPLFFNSSAGLWEGNVTLASLYGNGNLSYLGTGLTDGPFLILVTGESYNAVPTTVSLDQAGKVNVEPFNLQNQENITQPLPYSYLNNSKIMNFHGTLMDEIFQNASVIGSSLSTVFSSGSLNVASSNITLIDSDLQSLRAIDSHVTLIDSHVDNLVMVESNITLISSNVTSVYPALPIVKAPLVVTESGNFTFNFSVIGQDVRQVTVYLNGMVIGSFNTNGTHQVEVNTFGLKDGSYPLVIYVSQSDGLSSSHTTALNLNTQLNKLSSNVTNISSTLSSEISSENARLSSESARESQTSTYTEVAIGIAIIAIILSIISIVRRK